MIWGYPHVAEDVVQPGVFGRMKVLLVTDYFTPDCLYAERSVRATAPGNFKEIIGGWRPELVFVESAFSGANGRWRYELAKQANCIRLRQPKAICHLVELARSNSVPTVFWNKDDGAFFDSFIDLRLADSTPLMFPAAPSGWPQAA